MSENILNILAKITLDPISPWINSILLSVVMKDA